MKFYYYLIYYITIQEVSAEDTKAILGSHAEDIDKQQDIKIPCFNCCSDNLVHSYNSEKYGNRFLRCEMGGLFICIKEGCLYKSKVIRGMLTHYFRRHEMNYMITK